MGRVAHNKLTLEDIKNRHKNIGIDIIAIFSKSIGNKGKRATFVSCKCTKENCNHIWSVHHANLITNKTGCPKCAGKIVSDKNSIRSVRPDLIKYFQNESDVDKYSYGSNKKVQLQCPECGSKRNDISATTLSRQGFSCKICSDGISIPEKFGIYLLKQFGVSFETQKTFDWSKNKRYDFYIPSLNMIIESHGEQHYENKFTFNNLTKLQEEQENDKLKYDLAIQNGIKPNRYIVVDCRKSEFEWLKYKYITSLENHFNLSDIDWLEVWEESQSSLAIKVWDMWNCKNENDTTQTIGENLRVGSITIAKYLKIGNNLGKCIYDAKEENKKNGTRNGIKSRKTVYKYNTLGNFVQAYSSTLEASTNIGVDYNCISKCCLGKQKTSGGFKWSYNPPINGMYPD